MGTSMTERRFGWRVRARKTLALVVVGAALGSLFATSAATRQPAPALAESVDSAEAVEAAESAEPVFIDPGPRRILRAGDELSPDEFAEVMARVEAAATSDSVGIQSAPLSTFEVEYIGFGNDPSAQAAFQRAVDAWAAVISSTVPIKVVAEYEPLGAGILGSAGPAYLVAIPLGPYPGRYIPAALGNALEGEDLFPADDDVLASFNSSGIPWHFGTGVPPAGFYDFTTVVMHELGHGLGFYGLDSYNSGTGVGELGYDVPGFGRIISPYDEMTERADGTPFSTLANPSVTLGTALRSPAVIDAPLIRSANGGVPAPIYTPNTYNSGSSYSHFDEATYGSTQLMTPFLSPQEVHTTPGDLTMAVLHESGWAAPPGAPTISSATAGDRLVTLNWSAPVDTGSTPITSYLVTASPGGQQCLWTSGPLSCAVGGLTNGTNYTFTVQAVNSAGPGAAATSGVRTPQSPYPNGFADPGGFIGITPTRALDTRETGPCVGTTPRTLTIGGNFGIPAGTQAVALNVTVVSPWGSGYTTVWPAGEPMPDSSNLNFLPGEIVPNMVTVKLGTGGAIRLFSNNGCPHIVVDILGYYPSGTTTPGGLVGITPSRALDTRVTGPCVGTTPRTLTLAGTNGVPANATAVVLNVTVVSPWGAGYTTVWPAGVSRPGVSNLNFVAGQVVPNMVTVKLGTGGAIQLYSFNGCPNIVVDVFGYFTPGTPGIGGFTGLTPARVIDTRVSPPCVSTTPRTVTIAGTNGVPSTAGAAVTNVTVVEPWGQGFAVVWPNGTTQPLASNLNFLPGQVVPNMVDVRLGTGGAVRMATNNGCPNMLIDVFGYHSKLATAPLAPATPSAVPGDGQATVSWSAPTSDGGKQVTGYLVTPVRDGVPQSPREFTSTATSQVITGLTNGVSYRFMVQAVNVVGASARSTQSAAVTPVSPP